MPSYFSAIRSSGWRNLIVLALAWAWTTAAPAADKILFDFTAKADLTQIVTADAKVSAATSGAGLALLVATGHQATWPGVTLRAPGGSWDLSAFAQIATDIKNTGTNPITVFCRVDNPGADGVQHCVTGSLDLRRGTNRHLESPDESRRRR